MRIHNEYQYIKKRSLLNYLVNSRMNVEKHFHNRTITMLNNITKFEESNLHEFKGIAIECFQETVKEIHSNKNTKRSAFEAALDGIRSGEMNYQNDIVLPNLIDKIKAKTQALKSLSKEEEAKMLSLSAQ
jgi:hypothetical protein